MDRIDLHVGLEQQKAASLLAPARPESDSREAGNRVRAAQQRQLTRQGTLNAQLAGKALLDHCELDRTLLKWFEGASDRLGLSGRGIHKTLRVARTLADLSGEAGISQPLLLEALGYRSRLAQ